VVQTDEQIDTDKKGRRITFLVANANRTYLLVLQMTRAVFCATESERVIRKDLIERFAFGRVKHKT
jgi:hypothetical protein